MTDRAGRRTPAHRAARPRHRAGGTGRWPWLLAIGAPFIAIAWTVLSPTEPAPTPAPSPPPPITAPLAPIPSSSTVAPPATSTPPPSPVSSVTPTHSTARRSGGASGCTDADHDCDPD